MADLFVVGIQLLEVGRHRSEEVLARGRISARTVRRHDEGQGMDLQARCQVLDDADARNLVVLLNAAHVPSAGSQELVLLGCTPDCAQRSRRTTKVGLRRNILSRHCPGFRSTRPKRPRPIGLICPCRSTKPSLQRSRNMHLMRRSSALHMRRETRIIGFQIILDKRPSKRPICGRPASGAGRHSWHSPR